MDNIPDDKAKNICNNEDKIPYLVWPDSYYCKPDEFEAEMIAGKSDNYRILLVPKKYCKNKQMIDVVIYGILSSKQFEKLFLETIWKDKK